MGKNKELYNDLFIKHFAKGENLTELECICNYIRIIFYHTRLINVSNKKFDIEYINIEYDKLEKWDFTDKNKKKDTTYYYVILLYDYAIELLLERKYLLICSPEFLVRKFYKLTKNCLDLYSGIIISKKKFKLFINNELNIDLNTLFRNENINLIDKFFESMMDNIIKMVFKNILKNFSDIKIKDLDNMKKEFFKYKNEIDTKINKTINTIETEKERRQIEEELIADEEKAKEKRNPQKLCKSKNAVIKKKGKKKY